jgi:hypothetical protein
MIPSLPKLIALAAVLWTVWKVFHMFERRKEVARHAPDRDDANASGDTSSSGSSPDKKAGSLDLEECGRCGAWVSGVACERENCPYAT